MLDDHYISMPQSHMATSKQSPTIRIGLNEDQYRVLKVYCAREGLSISEFVTDMIKRRLMRDLKLKPTVSVDESDNRDD